MGILPGPRAHRASAQERDGGSVSRYVFKLPDLGEGTVEAEIVAWHVKPGDTVAEEDVIVEVMTDKASVEVPAPVSGRVLSTTGVPGDMVPVGAELIAFETDVGKAGETAPTAAAAESPRVVGSGAPGGGGAGAPSAASPASARSGRKLVRSRPAEHRAPDEPQTEEIKVIGIRRMIAQRMSEAKRNIPHFAYVEEFDITELDSLRRHLNSKLASGTPALTYLPFI